MANNHIKGTAIYIINNNKQGWDKISLIYPQGELSSGYSLTSPTFVLVSVFGSTLEWYEAKKTSSGSSTAPLFTYPDPS